MVGQTMTKEDMISFIENMSVLELSQLVKELENRFGVSAAAAIPIAGIAVSGAAGEAKAEEKTEFTIVLEDAGAEKIKVIKEVRAATNLGLKEAKELVEGAPKVVKEHISKDEAQQLKKKFEEVGAKITLK